MLDFEPPDSMTASERKLMQHIDDIAAELLALKSMVAALVATHPNRRELHDAFDRQREITKTALIHFDTPTAFLETLEHKHRTLHELLG